MSESSSAEQPKKKIDARHETRRVVVMALFSYSFFSDKDLLDLVEYYLSEFPPSVYDVDMLSKYTDEVVATLSTHDELIHAVAPDWPIDQMAKIDLAILRLALYELLVVQSAPYKVVINEAVELAKEFSGDASARFINGALGKVVKMKGLG
jgi:N utilization substance protein B